ncbi:hypothetical protein M2132_001789 [Dysgonomonas sp. PH5-45]|uniref:hypothetical protein n=1 Tax=unclassified Dysgonomonas TaxID=2630389 RepID=UPI002474AF00|nr:MULTISPECIES: hypothetical protein [unclassified Dysgonomonas]MDH6355446.1 hypothetical protein [Dysgonomonas sp. PH5-45]MDH6388343.1 hypothetical protein [Dysgonomonas sp. PH5-37]
MKINTNELKKKLQERLVTKEQAYAEVGANLIDFSIFPKSKREYKEAQYDTEIIVEAARKIEKECGYGEIDWSNGNQPKWQPWFFMSPSGFRFGDSRYDRSDACAGSGSRLHVLSEIASDHIGTTFSEIWEKVQLK